MVKPWNTDLNEVEADEKLYVDYEDEAKSKATNLKFKTNRIGKWIEVVREEYKVTDYEGKNGLVQHKNIQSTGGNFTINYYTTTGVVMIQRNSVKSDVFTHFKGDIFPQLQAKVNLNRNDTEAVPTKDLKQLGQLFGQLTLDTKYSELKNNFDQTVRAVYGDKNGWPEGVGGVRIYYEININGKSKIRY